MISFLNIRGKSKEHLVYVCSLEVEQLSANRELMKTILTPLVMQPIYPNVKFEQVVLTTDRRRRKRCYDCKNMDKNKEGRKPRFRNLLGGNITKVGHEVGQ